VAEWLDLSAVGIAQLAEHEVSESILCCEGQWCALSKWLWGEIIIIIIIVLYCIMYIVLCCDFFVFATSWWLKIYNLLLITAIYNFRERNESAKMHEKYDENLWMTNLPVLQSNSF